MTDNGDACPECKAHSAIRVRVQHVEETVHDQWTEINAMKKWLIATLTSSIFSLLGILGILAVALSRVN